MENNTSDNPSTEELEEAVFKQLKQFREEVSKLMETHGIMEYLVCVIHPANPNERMLVFDDEYEAAQLAARAHYALKEQIIKNIS